MGKLYVTYAASRLTAGVCTFLISLLLVNLLSITAYGQFSFAVSTAQTIAFLICFWVGASASLKLPGMAEQNSKNVISQYSLMSMIMAILNSLVICILMGVGFLKLNANFFLGTVFFGFLFGLHEIHMQILNARGLARDYALSTVLRYGGGLIGVFICFIMSVTDGTVIIFTMATAILMALLVPNVSKQVLSGFKKDGAIKFNVWGERYLSGLSALIVFGLWTLANYSNRAILHRNASAYELGLFATTTDFLNGPIALLFQILNLSAGPSIMSSINVGKVREFVVLSEKFVGTALFLGVTASTVLWYLGPSIVDMLAGAKLDSADVQFAGWIILNTVLACWFGVGGLVLLGARQKNLAVALALGTAVLNLALTWDQETAHGIAQNSALSMGVGTLFLCFFMLSKCGVKIQSRYLFASAIYVCILALGMFFVGELVYLRYPIVVTLIAILLSGIVSLAFNILDIRTVTAYIFRKFYSKTL